MIIRCIGYALLWWIGGVVTLPLTMAIRELLR